MAYFDKYGIAFSDDHRTLVRCPKDFQGDYVIPSGVTKIGENAFDGCHYLTGIEMPNGVIDIESIAFCDCGSLEYIILSNSIKRIGSCAFYDCCSLSSIVLPQSIEAIETAAFAGCPNLHSIFIPEGQIGRFSQMDGLKGIVHKLSERKEVKDINEGRSWEECERLWQEKYSEYAKQETEFAKIIFPLLECNHEPSTMPPIGICLSSEEYMRFKEEGRDFKKIHAWCWSGQEMHATMRMHLNAPSMAKIGEPIVGPLTPRIGIYKVVRMDSDSLYCYYIGKDIRDEDNNFDFLEEIVEINPSPLYNYYSKGPKDYDIVTGDIIIVTDNQLKQLHLSEGKTYSITWRFGNPKS